MDDPDFERVTIGRELRQSFHSKKLLKSSDNDILIEVKMSRKFIQDLNDGGSKYEFIVKLPKFNKKDLKVTRSYAEFLALEKHIQNILSNYDESDNSNKK